MEEKTMKDSNRLSIIIVFFIITTLISATPLSTFGQNTNSNKNPPPPYDYPENAIPLMKYWISESDLKLILNFFNGILNFLPVSEAWRLEEIDFRNYDWAEDIEDKPVIEGKYAFTGEDCNERNKLNLAHQRECERLRDFFKILCCAYVGIGV